MKMIMSKFSKQSNVAQLKIRVEDKSPIKLYPCSVDLCMTEGEEDTYTLHLKKEGKIKEEEAPPSS